MRKSFVCFSVALAGCSGGGGTTDIEASLVFADRTDMEIVRLINAAGGTDMFQAEAQINQFGDTFDADPCPVVTVDGQTATVTGGCTTADGVTIEGSAVVTNPLGWDQIEEYDFRNPTIYEFDALTLTQSGFTQSFDGYIRRTNSLTIYDADITVTQFDVTVRSDLYYRCSNPSSPTCTLSGSGIELVGVGGAQVSGQLVATTGSQVADYTLQGVDRLTVHVETGCVGWSIEGVADRGMTCP